MRGRVCNGCGEPTTAGDLCSTCRVHHTAAAIYVPTADDELTGGEWLAVRGVWRWVPTTSTTNHEEMST